ncbi:MAG: tyrosine-type recombinase/integrase [Oscillospiraceae bacterium]|nr:tyrosine-type recombinase/integrase [Oscillospiraceae bacterium]
MASVIPRNGKYAVVYYEGEDRHQKMKSGLSYTQAEKLKDRKTAEEKKWREQKKKDRQNAKPKEDGTANSNAGDNPTEATVTEFLEDFIVKYGTKHWGDSYFSSSKSKMNNYVYPYLGHHRIVDVTTKMIDDYYDFLIKRCVPVANRGSQRKKRVTPAAVHEIHKVLRTAFNQAKRWKNIRQNPFLDADVPEHKSKERPAFAPGEFEKILDYTNDASDYERYTIHVALCIQYYCTTRGGEVGALQWTDYNPKERTLHIYKALDRVDKKHLDLPKLKIYYTFPILNPYNKSVTVLKSPKTEATERFARLNNLMVEKLNRMKAMQEEMVDTIFGDYYQDNRLIICQPNGRPIMPEQLNRKFKAIIVEMRENGHEFTSVPENLLDEVVFHSVRAASATKKMQVSNGNIKAVMRAGGWAEPDMVIRYSKAYEDDQVDIANQMEDDYLKAGDAKPPADTEELLRIIQSHPDLITKLLAAVK